MKKIAHQMYQKYSKYERPEIEDFIIFPANEAIKKSRVGETFVIGVQGGNGSGKSTLSKCMTDYLKLRGYNAVTFSTDDFYGTRESRMKLSSTYPGNPFYDYNVIPRGMPGTHDVVKMRLALDLAEAGMDFKIPVFDKTLYGGKGDVTDETINVSGRQDFLIVEGIFWNMLYADGWKMQSSCLNNDMNLRDVDPELKYHKVIFNQLRAGGYEELWKHTNYMIKMMPTSLQLHKKWRWEQEKGNVSDGKGKGMTKAEVEGFVDRYLPLLAYCYDSIEADFTISIDENHRFHRGKK
jgi:D-glycerate 3-kinase